MSLFSWLRTRTSNRAQWAQRWPAPPRARLQLEALEDRWLPSYSLAGSYAVGTASAMATVDLNNDGKFDLITTAGSTKGGASVEVLLANPNSNGAFAAVKKYSVQNGGWSLVVADFNGDYKLDIVTGNSSGMSVLLGNGDGTFQKAKNSDLPLGTYLAAGYVNGDRNLDLVTDSSGGIAVLLGKGDGAFQAGPTYTGSGAAVAVGDFNADGKLDVVAKNLFVRSRDWAVLNLLPGNGDGTFGTAQNIFGSYDPAWAFAIEGVTVDDFNGDGTPDLAIADLYAGSQSTAENFEVGEVLLGGSGGFSESGFGGGFQGLFVSTGYSVVGLAAADVNGDGKLDLIAMNDKGTVDILSGHGDWTPGVGDHSYGTAWYPSGIANFVVGDFNGDGFADLAVLRSGSVDVYLWSSKTQWY